MRGPEEILWSQRQESQQTLYQIIPWSFATYQSREQERADKNVKYPIYYFHYDRLAD